MTKKPKCSPETCIPATKQVERMEKPSTKLKGAIRIYYETDDGKPINRFYRVSVIVAAKFDEIVKEQGCKEGWK